MPKYKGDKTFELLDENIRLHCNDVGGYWVQLKTGKRNGERNIFDFPGWWVCRVPVEVIEDAAEEVKSKRGDYRNYVKPCVYFGGESRKFHASTYPAIDFRRFGFPDGVEDFIVCDIPYDGRFSKTYPLTDDVAYESLKRFSYEPPKNRVYDNYEPSHPNHWLIKHPKTENGEEHYHMNYEGSQKKLYHEIKRNLQSAVDDKTILYEKKLRMHKPLFINQFSVNVEENGVIGQALLIISVYPGKNAMPRIGILRYTDIFDHVLHKTFKEHESTGLMVGGDDIDG